ncbi:REP-associated tyrosine transposase [Thiohalorhabdus methylotrophus]|uniref:Transposase n=1 Tax=Thiohalorhabdus methylotrophus TaxID=3242694 RepID=A0ABV4TWY1_9GAMM
MPPDDPPKGYRQLCKGRTSIPGQVYILTTVTHLRRPVFSSLNDARILIRTLRHQHESGQVDSLAFVVMPDHLHWLVALRDSGELSKVMRSVKTYSARKIQSRCEMAPSGGRFWQTGFHDRAVRREEDFRALARYIVANPLRAGLAEKIGDYPHWDAVWLDGGDPAGGLV